MKKLKLSGSRSSGTRNITPLAGLRHQSLAGSESSAEPTSESEPEEDSDYDSGSEEEVEPEEVSPLPANRPNDPSKATEYDIIKAVWAKRSVALSSTIIRAALGEYWAILKAVRDKWKLEMTALGQAEEKKNHTRVVEHERRALNQRRLLESCVRLTLKYGHRDIVEKYVPSLSRLIQYPLQRVHAFVMTICTTLCDALSSFLIHIRGIQLYKCKQPELYRNSTN